MPVDHRSHCGKNSTFFKEHLSHLVAFVDFSRVVDFMMDFLLGKS